MSDEVENNEVIIFDTAHGEIYELNEISSYVWTKLESDSLENIINSICNNYIVDKNMVCDDITEMLINLGLVKIASTKDLGEANG